MEEVRVIDTGKTYPEYESWIHNHFSSHESNWIRGDHPTLSKHYDKIGEVGDIVLIRDQANSQVYMIDKKGLEYVGGTEPIKKGCIYTTYYQNAMPTRHIVEKKNNATVLFWFDGTKTIVKPSKEDKFDKRIGFLTAYFQKQCGMSKTKANKFLDSLMEEEDHEVK